MAIDHNPDAALIQRSAGAPVPAANAAAPPAAGSEIEASVVERTTPDGASVRGVVVGGKFFQVDLPPQIKNGDSIVVKAFDTPQGAAFVFVRPAAESAAQEPHTGRPFPPALRALGIDERVLLAAAQALTQAATPAAADDAAAAALRGVLSRQVLENADVLLDHLLKADLPGSLDRLSKALASPLGDRALEEKAAKVSTLLSEVTSRLPARNGADSLAEPRPVERLLNLLSSTSDPQSQAELRSKLTELVRQQLSAIDAAKERIQRLVASPARPAVDELLLTLGESGSRGGSVAVKQFSAEQRIDLYRAKESGDEKETITTLERGLAGARALLRTQSDGESVRMLRLIEAQSGTALATLKLPAPGAEQPVRTSYAEPLIALTRSLGEEAAAAGYKDTSAALGRLTSALEDLSARNTPESRLKLSAARSEFSAAVAGEVPQDAELRPLFKAVQSAVDTVLRAAREPATSAGSGPPQIPGPFNAEIELKAILDALRSSNTFTHLLDLQLERIGDLGPALKHLLSAEVPKRLLDALLDTVSRVELIEAPKNDLERRFNDFISGFRQDLGKLIKESADPGKVKEELTGALRRMYDEFDLVPLETRAFSARPAPPGDAPRLPQRQVNALRGLEVQIKTLLELSDEQLVGPQRAALFAELISPLSELVDEASRQHGAHENSPFARFVAVLRDRLELLKSPEAGAGDIRAALAATITDIADLYAGAPAADPPAAALGGRQLAILRSLELLIRTASGAERAVAPGTPPQAENSHIRPVLPADEALLGRLREAVLELKTAVPADATPAQRALGQLAGSLLEHLEQRGQATGAGQLQTAFDLITRQYLPQRDAEMERALSRFSPEALRSLDTLVAGHEGLQRMAPVLQALGEPVMILFPGLVSGLVSKLEITALPAMPDKKKRKGDRAHRRDTGGAERELFRQYRFNVDLPALGGVRGHLAHRTGELLLSMVFDREDAAGFVRPRLLKLEAALRACGFKQVAVSAVASERPG